MTITFYVLYIFISIHGVVMGGSLTRTKTALLSQLSPTTRLDEKFVVNLEALQDSSSLVFPDLFDQLDGEWALQYSNRGLSPGYVGPPLFPKIVSVTQRIDSSTMRLDNSVTLSGPLGDIKIILGHAMQVQSDSFPAVVRINFDSLVIDASPSPLLPTSMDISALLGPQLLPRTGLFETSFCDEDMRISRGERGEMRVFSKMP